MARLKILALIAIATFLLSPAISLAQGSLPPCRFHGTVQLDDASVPDGTVITVVIGNDTYITTTPSVYGNSTYAIMILPPADTSYTDGTPITFNIGDYEAVEKATWDTGANVVLNLTASATNAPTPTTEPSQTPGPEVTPAPTSTGPSIETPAPTSTPSQPPSSGKQVNKGRVIGLAIFGIFDVLLIGALAYLAWRFFIRRQNDSPQS